MSSRNILILLAFVVAVVGWQLFDSHQRNSALAADLRALQAQVATLEQQLASANARLAVLQEGDVGERVKRANSTLLDAWHGLLKRLEQEVDSARESLEQTPPPHKPAPSDKGQELEHT